MICLGLVAAACERAADDKPAQTYEVRGIVRGFSPDRSTIEIQHENIPDFMPSMTMPFVVRDQKEIADLRVGDAIAFRMSVTQKDFWIDRVKKIRREDVDLAEPRPTATPAKAESARLREGDAMPVFHLTNQNGESISLESYRGRPFVLTFIFTRCPIPNFCPRMSNNFEEIQEAIQKNKLNARLLSITLDPKFDTPEVLQQYGKHLHLDPTIWNLVTGDEKEIDGLTNAFSVYRQNEGGTISHGLATALIDKDGKIDKIWRGNAWSPAEVVNVLEGLQ